MRELAGRTQAIVHRHPFAVDVFLSLALAAAALVSVKSIYDEIHAADPTYATPATASIVLAMLGITLPLAARRRFPLTVALITTAAFLLGRIVVEVPEASMTVLAGSLAIYSAAAHGQRRLQALVVAVCLAAIVGEVARELFFVPEAAGLKPLTQVFVLVYNAVFLALPWIAGSAMRTLRDRERELAERAADLQREREENARQAVFAERVRISRELHDVVAHHVSVMGVQAGAARRVMEREPEKAAEALTSVEASSRQAVVELHRLLGFLRRADDADELAPQPGLAQLGELISEAERSELAVELMIEGEPRPLSPTLEVNAYRIIQEALTNTRKYASRATATVRVNYGATTLEVEVLDDGAGSTTGAHGGEGGHGLIGMRERVSLHGGQLRAGPLPDGGFVVRATFPLDESVS